MQIVSRPSVQKQLRLAEHHTSYHRMKAGIISLLTLITGAASLGLNGHHNQEIRDAISRADSQLTERQLGRNSLHGRRYRGKKFTTTSLAMQARNELFRKTLAHLRMDNSSLNVESMRNVNAEVASHLVQKNEEFERCNCAAENRLSCLDSPYRSIDGVCNNLEHPDWGSTNIPMRRAVPPQYADGHSIPRGGLSSAVGHCRTGGIRGDVASSCAGEGDALLPNPRQVSIEFMPAVPDVEDRAHSHMLTLMGQFLDHDMTFAPEIEAECCENEDEEGCFLIGFPCSEQHFTPAFLSSSEEVHGVCTEKMRFTRSVPFCESEEEHREQFNVITAFVDASNVYGNTPAVARALRTMKGGLLRFTGSEDRALLPIIDGEYVAGDIRSNENPALTAIHTLFVREHNRIAKSLVSDFGFDPELDDSEIYEIARKIVGAEMQNIVYGQFLEAVLGKTIVNQGGIKERLSVQAPSKYQPDLDPSIQNGFAAAVFRFGHSMVRDFVTLIQSFTLNRVKEYRLEENFFVLDAYLRDDGRGVDEILLGTLMDPAKLRDRVIVSDLTDNLFTNMDFPGFDLMARNIQRGRDHGIPGYNAYRELCGLEPVCSWNNRPTEINAANWEILRQLYNSPADIDLWTVGMAEDPVPGGVVGPVFACLMRNQFERLKYGDRYFFTHIKDDRLKTHGFTNIELLNLRNRHLGDIICDNVDTDRSKKNVFKSGPLDMRCSERKELKLAKFVIPKKVFSDPILDEPDLLPLRPALRP